KSPNEAARSTEAQAEGGCAAEEAMEPRAGAEENASRQNTHRTQSRERVSNALERVRQRARQQQGEKFTALLHHINPDTLEFAFYALRRNAAPGVDGVTWREYEQDLEVRLAD